MAAWIEIQLVIACLIVCMVAALVAAWIEILFLSYLYYTIKVAALVAAWIEIILSQVIKCGRRRRRPCGGVD